MNRRPPDANVIMSLPGTSLACGFGMYRGYDLINALWAFFAIHMCVSI